MTSSAGKTSILGEVDINGKKAFALKFNESRNMEWMDKVYLAAYDESTNTVEKLKPLEGNKHFYEEELDDIEKELQKSLKKRKHSNHLYLKFYPGWQQVPMPYTRLNGKCWVMPVISMSEKW